jgi:phage shock protein PspC (stress-responsive transcriptional regulator)
MTQDNHVPADDDPAEDVTAKVPPTDPADPPPPPPPPLTPPPPPPPTGGFPPPGAGFPPPGGFPPPPPGTAGWATRYGLVRPASGRVLAGVCAAVGRATNTDPVLWRVLFAVLSLIGGIGIVAYLVGWLLIPAEGDTGSPLEGLLGRGRSSTSPVVVVLVGIVAAIAATSFLFNGSRHVLLLVVLVTGAVLLINRATGRHTGPPVPPPADPAPYTVPQADATSAFPAAEPATGGYRPPFAPHGPYVTSPYPYPGLVTAPPPPVKPARPPSRLGRVTFSLLLLVLGVVALVDVVGHERVPFAGYLAAALAAVGLGLVIGAWFGRARGLIALGIVLSVALAIAGAAGDMRGWRGSAGDITWQPATMAELSDRYEHGAGNVRLDLSQLDFTGQDKHVTVRLNVGDLRVIVPTNTDVEVTEKVNVGDATVFDQRFDGINTPRRTVTNNGPDGPGGGHLTLDVQLAAGNLEVTR